MELWVVITLIAATAQTGRFMLQKHLKATQLSTAGATFARFIYSAPIIVAVLVALSFVTKRNIPALNSVFLQWAMIGGVSQILATMCTVALFAQRNFAVGITFKKTEVVLAAIFGLIILGDRIAPAAMGAIIIGLVGVLLLSDAPQADGSWIKRVFNRASGLGLASGVLFGMSGIGYRGASLSLGAIEPFYAALTTLAFVTSFQTVIMLIWLRWRETGEISKVLKSWRISGLVGITSMIGSYGWFYAFTLQTVALVKAVGQVELILSVLASILFFRERITGRELGGLALLAVSIVTLISFS